MYYLVLAKATVSPSTESNDQPLDCAPAPFPMLNLATHDLGTDAKPKWT